MITAYLSFNIGRARNPPLFCGRINPRIDFELARAQEEASQIIRGSIGVKSREPETSKIIHFEITPGDILSTQPISVRNGRAGYLAYLFLQMD